MDTVEKVFISINAGIESGITFCSNRHCIYSDSFATIMKTNLKNGLTYTGILASTIRR